MPYKAFSEEAANHFIDRINKLKPESKALWGKMQVSQMMQHCTIPYLQVKDDTMLKAPFFIRKMLQFFFKADMVGGKPFSKNLPTLSFFMIKNVPDFEKAKANLISEVKWFGQQDALQFNNRKHSNLGKLTTQEWDNLVFKHLDHHLRQFGV